MNFRFVFSTNEEEEEDDEIQKILKNETFIFEKNNINFQCKKINNIMKLLYTLRLHLKNKNFNYIVENFGDINEYNKEIKDIFTKIHLQINFLIKLQHEY